ncbi:MAG TPA: Ig-like domain-containing protein [Candidatus Acidoferrales bacterium]|nr:Ig-like domain-containing protein [Candidatus Acidoferrales bacterium]
MACGLHAACPGESVTLGANPSSLLPGQTANLTAAVKCSSGTTDPNVVWTFSPAVTGAVPGPATTVADTTTGISANTYTAPVLSGVSQSVKVTVQTVDGSNLTASATLTLTPPLDVGTGAPTPSLQFAFLSAFYRNSFNNLVLLPPAGTVKKLGTTGYVQEFTDKNSSAKLALVTISPTAPVSGDGTSTPVVQLLGDLYTYYTSVGVATAGYPMSDTINCPAFDAANSCTYDIFDKNYALFAYHASLVTGQDFTIRLLFYTEWTRLGGITGLGRPIDVETAITAAVITGTTGNTATFQSYSNGNIYSVTSGPNNGKVFSVLQPILNLYVSNGGPSGSLGLPTGEEIVLANGDHSQTFEGASLRYTPGGGGPVLHLPVSSVVLSGAGVIPGTVITLNLGQSVTLTASPLTSTGVALTDRVVSWTTTNSRAVQIQASNLTAVVKAVGGGSATVTAASEGVISPKLIFNVIAPCCQIGDGAPAPVQQAFQAALTRNKLTVQVPVASPAQRAGNGYVQPVQSAGATPVTYLLAQSDRLGTAFVLSGGVLSAYQALGGPAGALGYPATDQSVGGTQQFENSAALGGNPVRLVTGAVLSKWALLGLDSGVAGAPASDPGTFSTFGANSGVSQSFAGGTIYAATAGPRAGQAYLVSGLILARYNFLGAAGGAFGMPVGDEFVTGSLHQQNFEGGNFTYTAGDAVAVEHAAPKNPGVIVSPVSLTAGGRAQLAVVGFPNNSSVRVSVTGQPDFLVTTATGAYSWDMFFPLSSASATIAIHAVGVTGGGVSGTDLTGGPVADGTLTVRGLANNRVPISKIQGDNQTGAPGTLLPLALRVVLRDGAGNPVTGAPVSFQASSGAQVTTPITTTDATGQAQTFLRLPSAEGIALVDVETPPQNGVTVAQSGVTFAVRAAAAGLSNFPNLQQAGTAPLGNGTATIGQKGALLTAVAGILRYHQNRGELAAPNGTADPAALNAFLKADCGLDSKGNQNCDGFWSNPDSGEQIVNLWRAADFAGGVDVSIENAALSAVADLVAQGWPVLLSLRLQLNGAVTGGHFVVATGVAADGSIVIQDPSPLFARTSLRDYLTGFTVGNGNGGNGNGGIGSTGNGSAGNGTWKADLLGAARFVPRSPAATRFLLGALSQPADLMKSLTLSPSSAAGGCGQQWGLLDGVDASGNGPAKGPLVSLIGACDGSQPAYQIDVGAVQPFHAFVTDLASGGATTDLSGSAPAVYQATRPQLNLVLTPQGVSFTSNGVVNAATFTAGIAPGGLMAIFGTGLAGSAQATSVDMDGTVLRLIYTSAFQINAEVPAGIAPGVHTMRIQSAFGEIEQPVTVSAVAPEIFLVGNPPVGALVNPDNSLNGPLNPLARGQALVIYCTGLGAVTKSGQLSVASTPVTVVLNGTALPAAFAGLTPGYIGLYQVNVIVPAATPPGLGIFLTLKQGEQLSNSLVLALQ